MQISIRSYLTAGMAAVVGASAISFAPALPATSLRAVELPAPVVMQIALTGTSLPIDQILSVLQTLIGGGSITNIIDGLLGSVGNEIFSEVLPIIRESLGDVTSYLGAALTGLLTGPDGIQGAIGTAVRALPALLATAAGAIGTGGISTALKTLTDGLAAPLNEINHAVQAVAVDFQAFLATEVGGLLETLPGVLQSAVQTVLGFDIGPALDAIIHALSGLLPGVFPAAVTVVAPTALAAAAEVVAAEPAVEVPAAVTSRSAESLRAVTVDEAPAPVSEAPAPKPAAVAPAAAAAPEAAAPAPEVNAAVVDAPEAVPAEVAPAAPVVVADEPVAPVTRPEASTVRAEAAEPAEAAAAAPAPSNPKRAHAARGGHGAGRG